MRMKSKYMTVRRSKSVLVCNESGAGGEEEKEIERKREEEWPASRSTTVQLSVRITAELSKFAGIARDPFSEYCKREIAYDATSQLAVGDRKIKSDLKHHR